MQNNVTELTQRLLGALDANYNVIDMATVIEVVSLLEKVTVTKELLETTRLGKHVNELRRKTDNDGLSKRAKELVKKWRTLLLPPSESNGQLKSTATPAPPAVDSEDSSSRPPTSRKRAAKEAAGGQQLAKRPKVNGQSELFDLSDNSNSSFKDALNSRLMKHQRDVILINSDNSNSSQPDIVKQDPQLEQQLPKKRGRKKGSKNHRSLIDEAETSFTNKLAVSRGNSKVKTTQELVAGLQNKSNALAVSTSPLQQSGKPKEDLTLRAAKLTERVSIIDQKLNTNANRYKNSQKKSLLKISIGGSDRNDRVIESGSVINDKRLVGSNQLTNHVGDEEIIVVDDVEPSVHSDRGTGSPSSVATTKEEDLPPPLTEENRPRSLSVEEALARLPPIDLSVLQQKEGEEEDEVVICTCSIAYPSADEEGGATTPHFVVNDDCAAQKYFEAKKFRHTPEDLHATHIESVNGNFGLGPPKGGPALAENGLYANVVPNVNIERIPKDVTYNNISGGGDVDSCCENYKKYSISEAEGAAVSDGADENESRTGGATSAKVGEEGGASDEGSDRVFCEWHEVLDRPSYDGEIMRILPWVTID